MAMKRLSVLATLLVPATLSAQAPLPRGVEAISLLGDTLRAPELYPAARARLTAQLDSAERAWERSPESADAIIWVGRRTAYLGRYRDAIGIFSLGIAKHPEDARLYRHRGHRYITVRRLDRAIEDLSYAATLTRGEKDQVEPDGQPNARNIPVSTLQSNIWYHLALAYYLKGDFRNAAAAWRRDVAVSTNADMQVASRYWLYMTLRRMGQPQAAAEVLRPITRRMEIIENGSYHRLLLLFQGTIPADSLFEGGDADPALQDATVRYGLGNWHWINGRRDEAMRIWRDVVKTGPWASFGYIAAEAELGRRGR
jgi:tetratricopeptide (TPR) repeat protein